MATVNDLLKYKVEKVTPDNCVKLCNDKSDIGEGGSRSGAWRVVYEFCSQNGMRYSNKSGILSVISFLKKLVDENKRLKKQLKNNPSPPSK